MKYLGPITDGKDLVNKDYVDSGLASKVPTSDYSPVTKTADMTQAVGRDANGQLWTEPGVEINLGITGAAAADFVRVQTVDGSGRPTAYGKISFADAAAAIIAQIPNGMEVAW